MPPSISLKKLIENVLNVYYTLLDIGSHEELEWEENRIRETIKLLEEPDKLVKKLKDNRLSEHKMFLLASAIFESFALSAAAGGDNLSLVNADLLAKTKEELKSTLRKKEQVEDYLFSIIVQSWINSKDHLMNVGDLRHNKKFKDSGNRVCDFKIQPKSQSSFELCECKRIHPASDDSATMDKMVDKISEKISIAIKQLSDTEQNIGTPSSCKHLLIDISAYGENYKTEKEDHAILGFSREEHIKAVLARIKGKSIRGVDVINICWTNIIRVNDLTIAKIFETEPCFLTGNLETKFNFRGYTTEMYPMSPGKQLYQEIRIASRAFSPDRIRFTYANLTNPKKFWGESKFVDSKSKGGKPR